MEIDGDFHYCHRSITFETTGAAALRRAALPHLRLKFNFSFKFETTNWILHQDSTTLEFAREDSSSEHQASVALPVAAGGSLSYDDTLAAIGEAAGDRLTEWERRLLVEVARIEASENFPAAGTLAPEIGEIEIGITARVEVRQVVIVDGGGGGDGLVPAAESALEMLEECEAECGSGCCICLEEFAAAAAGGGGGVRMPCKHVFHGECIKEWLRSSHITARFAATRCRRRRRRRKIVDEFDER